MKFEVNVSKKTVFPLLVGFFIVVGLIGVMATWSAPASPVWHDASTIKVTIAGADYDLQEAITLGLMDTPPVEDSPYVLDISYPPVFLGTQISAINQAKIESICGDIDGCDIYMLVSAYDITVKFVGPLPFFYNISSRISWNSLGTYQDGSGIEASNVVYSVLPLGISYTGGTKPNGCYFLDSDMSGTSDTGIGFILQLVRRSGLTSQGGECRLIIKD